jgi:glycosyltransferase involved in cell wall biosynthesis
MYPPVQGGSAMYAFELANALGANNHQVDVVTQSNEQERTVEPHPNVQVCEVTPSRRQLVTFETLLYSIKARFNMEFNKYDIIHGTLMPASPIGLIGKNSIECPVVVTSHSFAPSEVRSHSAVKLPDYLLKYFFHPMNACMDFVTSHAVDQVITISTKMHDQLSEHYRVSENKISTIPHGVDTNRFYPDHEAHPAVNPDTFTLLFVGRLISRKNASLAIEAVSRLQRDDIELIIAGTGRLQDELKRMAQESDVSEHITFLGYVPESELEMLYAGADMTAFTSTYEGFGLVVLESLAAGTPVVGTPVGSVPDLITDRTEGFIRHPTADSFADAITTALDNPQLYMNMSENARTLAEEHSWDEVAVKTELVYERTIASNS